jgi:hypothetical protein
LEHQGRTAHIWANEAPKNSRKFLHQRSNTAAPQNFNEQANWSYARPSQLETANHRGGDKTRSRPLARRTFNQPGRALTRLGSPFFPPMVVEMMWPVTVSPLSFFTVCRACTCEASGVRHMNPSADPVPHPRSGRRSPSRCRRGRLARARPAPWDPAPAGPPWLDCGVGWGRVRWGAKERAAVKREREGRRRWERRRRRLLLLVLPVSDDRLGAWRLT